MAEPAARVGVWEDLLQSCLLTGLTNHVASGDADFRYHTRNGRNQSPVVEALVRASTDNLYTDTGVDDSVEIIAGGSFDETDLLATAPRLIPERKVSKGRNSNDGSEPTAEELLQQLQQENRQLKTELQECRQTIDRLCAEAMKEEERIEELQEALDEAQGSTYAAEFQLKMVKQEKEQLQCRVQQLMFQSQAGFSHGSALISPLRRSNQPLQGLKDLAVELTNSACNLSPARRTRSTSPTHSPTLRPLLARLDADYAASIPSVSPPSESDASVADSCTSVAVGGGANAGCSSCTALAEQGLLPTPTRKVLLGLPDIATLAAAGEATGSAPAALLAAAEPSISEGTVPALPFGCGGKPYSRELLIRLQGDVCKTPGAATGSCPAAMQLSGAAGTAGDLPEEEDLCVASLGFHLPALSGTSPPDNHAGRSTTSSSTPGSRSHSPHRLPAHGEDGCTLVFPQLTSFAQSPILLGADPVSPFTVPQVAEPDSPRRPATASLVQPPAAAASSTSSTADPTGGASEEATGQQCAGTAAAAVASAVLPGTALYSTDGAAAAGQWGLGWVGCADEAFTASALGSAADRELLYAAPGIVRVPSPVFPGIDNVQLLQPVDAASVMPVVPLPLAMPFPAPANSMLPSPRGGLAASFSKSAARGNGMPPSLTQGAGAAVQSLPSNQGAPGTYSGCSSTECSSPCSDGASSGHVQDSRGIPIGRKSSSMPNGQYSSSQGQYSTFRIDRIDVAPSVQTLPLFPQPASSMSFSLPAYQVEGGFGQPSPRNSGPRAGSINSGLMASLKKPRWEGEEDGSDSEL